MSNPSNVLKGCPEDVVDVYKKQGEMLESIVNDVQTIASSIETIAMYYIRKGEKDGIFTKDEVNGFLDMGE